jgi:hypothetical protein
MCTVSWWRKDGNLRVTFNRDEQRNRAAAEPPRKRDGVVAPLDPEGGGTWIALDGHGTVHCLLNLYTATKTPPPSRRRSRGLLPFLSAEYAERSLNDWLDPADWDGFYLLRIPVTGPVERCSWDGTDLQAESLSTDPGMLTTSSRNPEQVLAHRQRLFHETVVRPGVTGERLERFHLTPDPEHPAFSPMMEREDARTVSVSRILFRPERWSFHYQAIAPSGWQAPVEISG